MDKTVYILEDRKIRVEWTILKGTSPVREDFRRALVKVFLIGNCEKYLLEATADRGTLMIDIPEGLEPGLYSLEAIWVKNAGHPGRHDRDLCRSMKQDLFAITEFEEEATNLPEGTVVLKAKSSTATYGYDGLSSYELAVLRGEWNGTEGEWLKHQRYVSVLDGRGDSEVDTMSQKSITEELVKHDTAIEDTNKEIDTAQTDIKNLNDEMEEVQDRLAYIPKESFLSSEPACDYHTEDNQDELTVSRAIKDRFGRIIDEHYVTRETVKDYTQEVVDGSKLEIQPGSVQPEDLSPAVQQMIESAAAQPGHITNLPDEEDLTVTEHNTLQFKDREYNPYNYSGMGKVYLRKHIVNGTNMLTQHMMTKPNTIYVIRYDYCLGGETIEVPEGCVLEFDGGSLRNGTLKGNGTTISSCNICFDTNVVFIGKFVGSWHSKWWFTSDIDDAGIYLNKILRDCIKTDASKQDIYGYIASDSFVLDKGDYKISSTVNLSSIAISLDFDNSNLYPTASLQKDDFIFNTVDASTGAEGEKTDFAKGFGGRWIRNLHVDGSNSLCGGIRLYWSFKQSLVDINMYEMYNTAIKIGDHCAETYCERISARRRVMRADGDICGFISETSDSNFNNIVMVHYPIGLKFSSSAIYVTGCHPWGYCKSQGYDTTMKIGFYLDSCSIYMTNNVVDTYEKLDNSKKCSDIVDGQLNGGCGIYIDNAYHSEIHNIIAVTPNSTDKPKTIYVKDSWRVLYENISGFGIEYEEGSNADLLKLDSFVNVADVDDSRIRTVDIDNLYQGNIAEKRFVATAPTDKRGEKYNGRVFLSFYRGATKLGQLTYDDLQSRSASIQVSKKKAEDDTYFQFTENGFTFYSEHPLDIGASNRFWNDAFVNNLILKSDESYPDYLRKGMLHYDKDINLPLYVDEEGASIMKRFDGSEIDRIKLILYDQNTKQKKNQINFQDGEFSVWSYTDDSFIPLNFRYENTSGIEDAYLKHIVINPSDKSDLSNIRYHTNGGIDMVRMSSTGPVYPIYYYKDAWRFFDGVRIDNKRSGNTSSRPSNDIEVGFQYFDTTLNKPIWWAGSHWVDATGSQV